MRREMAAKRHRFTINVVQMINDINTEQETPGSERFTSEKIKSHYHLTGSREDPREGLEVFRERETQMENQLNPSTS